MARTADDFLVDIAARPDDDGLKAVFADWLLERGDVRGELMALQLKAHRTDEERSREALLLKANLKHWLPDEILINLVPSSIVFEKGVFTAARIQVRSQSALTASLTHPVWGTARRLSAAPRELLARCPVLEELTEIDDGLFVTLPVEGPPLLRLQTLGVRAQSAGALAPGLGASAYPALRELRLGFPLVTRDDAAHFEPRRLKGLFESPLGKRLHRLVLHTGWLDLEPWLYALDGLAPQVAELQLTPMAFEATNWWVRFSNGRRDVTVYPGSDLNASYSEGPVRELLATALRGYFRSLTLLDGVEWASVRKLPCFEGAVQR